MKRMIVVGLILMATACFGQTGRHGSSLLFDGTSSIVTAPDANSLDLAVPFTVESWFNIKFKNWGTLLAKSRSSGTTALWNYGVISYADKHIYFAVGNGVASSDGISITSLRDDLWYHAVFTVSSDSVRAYIQGAKTGAVVRTITPFTDTSSLKIGYAALTPNGNMDEIRLYSRALSATEAAWNYRHPDQPYSRDSLKLWLQMNEYTGVTAYDSSGLGNNGTISGATWNIETPVYADKATHGSSLWFDGVNDSIVVNDANSLDFTTSFTAELWHQRPVLGGALISKFQGAGQRSWFLFTNWTINSYYLTLSENGTNQTWYAFGSTNIVPPYNKWNHVVMVYDGSVPSCKLYVNDSMNVFVVVSGTVPASIFVGTTPVIIGNNSDGKYQTGNIDEVRLYSRAITRPEISWNYRHPSQPYDRTNLQLWLQMNEYAGATTADSSGNGNTGTLVGPTWSIETP